MASCEVPIEATLQAFRLAQGHAMTMLNPAPARPLPKELLALVDVLTPNQFFVVWARADGLIRTGCTHWCLASLAGSDGGVAVMAQGLGDFVQAHLDLDFLRVQRGSDGEVGLARVVVSVGL